MKVRALCIPFLVAGLAGAALAGTVEVRVAEGKRFTDAGNHTWDEPKNVESLSRYLKGLGTKMLPADQTLRIELLDVDLAGGVGPGGTRVLRGRTDIPRIQLRYSLESPGKPARTGEETVTDPNYGRGTNSVHRNEPLFYEKRMLNAWFKERFGAKKG
jgi:hypothetical protein